MVACSLVTWSSFASSSWLFVLSCLYLPIKSSVVIRRSKSPVFLFFVNKVICSPVAMILSIALSLINIRLKVCKSLLISSSSRVSKCFIFSLRFNNNSRIRIEPILIFCVDAIFFLSIMDIWILPAPTSRIAVFPLLNASYSSGYIASAL